MRLTTNLRRINKSFIEDVEAVKDLLPRAESEDEKWLNIMMTLKSEAK